MAGKRQHYVPQFLQRGFQADEPGEAGRTWLHWRGQSPRLAAIKDIGRGVYFYSKPATGGAVTLDDHITAAESEFVSSLEALRAAPPGNMVGRHVAARLVTHLAFRTAHVRASLTLAATLLLDRSAEFISTTELMREAMGIDGGGGDGNEPRLMDRLVRNAPFLMRDAPPALAERIVTFLARERFDDFYAATLPDLKETLVALGQGVPKTIEGTHNTLLGASGFTQREQALATLSWQTIAVSNAILPDCVAVAHEANGEYVPLLLSDWDAVESVILPLSHDRLLVGTKQPCNPPDIRTLNRASAACSDSFFVSKDTDHDPALGALIGQRLAQYMASMINEAIAEHVPQLSTSAQLPASTPHLGGSTSFRLSCQGFATQDEAATLASIIAGIVREVGRAMPLGALDGITFADNYPLALEQLDRGDVALGTDTSRPRSYGRAVAKCVRVVRDGRRKEHLVFDAQVAMMLVGETEESRHDAIHLLVNMLANVAHTTLFEEPIEGMTVTFPPGVLVPLHPVVSTTPGMYYAARESAFAQPHAGERYRVLVLDSLDAARKAIYSTKATCIGGDDVRRLLDTACPAVASVLEHAAQWLGHRDGLPDQEVYPGADLISDLRNFDLDRWLDLFGRDLRRIYAADGEFSPDNLCRLGRHVERLLWSFRIFPWPQPDGEMYVTFFGEPTTISA